MSVDVSLNDKRVSIRFKPGNTLSMPQIWTLLREKGYTSKETVVTARGEPAGQAGQLQLKVAGTKDTILLGSDPKNQSPYNAAAGKVGQTVVVKGVMLPGKDLKAPVPLLLGQIQ